jgi:hypothetical protein
MKQERQKKKKWAEEKEKPVAVPNYNENMIGADLKTQLPYTYLLQRKKVTKWYIKMFRRLLSASVLNSMIICRADSQGRLTDHLKFRIDMVQSLLLQHGGGVERKVLVCHSTFIFCFGAFSTIFCSIIIGSYCSYLWCHSSTKNCPLVFYQ